VALAAALWLPAPRAAWALGEPRLVAFTPETGAIPLVAGREPTPLVVDAGDHAGVRRAAGDLRLDIERVTGLAPDLLTEVPASAGTVVIAGTLGKSRLVAQLVESGRLDVSAIEGRWEASIITTLADPLPGVDRAVVVVGSDKRGTIFALYDLSEQIGVSPFYWWADVPVRQHPELFVVGGPHLRGEPKVRYRGIFINDEAPALSGWVVENFGGFNSKFYVRVFELILRLRGNFLWPAMWGRAFADDDPENPRLADEYGVVIGTSHHEPMMRAHDEWRRYGEGPWDYSRNPEVLRRFWTEGITRVKDYEKIVTLAMRGDGDEPMSEEANVALLEKIVADQRELIAEHLSPDVTAVPQVWALYKEVQGYYERGMRVPDDVTLLWCDDNWGNIRRLPTAAERKRAGGAGIYYHFDYVGGPRSYKWLNVTPLPKVWEQMHLAYRYDANRIWIVNVGDIKPMELPIQFFLDYAWDPERWPAERISEYTRLWAEREFGEQDAAEIAEIVAGYTRFNSRRRPEMLEPDTYSLVDYHEADRVVEDYRALEARAEAVAARLPAEAQDAFFELVLHPVKACAVLNDLYVTVGRNRLYAVQGRTSTNRLVDRARELFEEDAEISRRYNEQVAGGKWHHMMDQTHIGYTYWNQPLRNAMPGVQRIQPSARPALGVAVEGAPWSWPEGGPPRPQLPTLSVFDPRPRSIDVFNRGLGRIGFSIESSDPWLQVDVPQGEVELDQRVWVRADWAAVPIGASGSTLTITGTDGSRVEIGVPLQNPENPRPEQIQGFVETNGYVSIEAEHYSEAVASAGRHWQTIPGHGRTLSGVTAFPVDRKASLQGDDVMRLEYPVHLFSAGEVKVQVQLAPTQNFLAGSGLRYAVSFGDEPPQIVNLHEDTSLQAWERSVADGATILTTTHTIAAPGPAVLKIWALDPGVVFQKIVIDTGGLKPSYLGPPESPRLPPAPQGT